MFNFTFDNWDDYIQDALNTWHGSLEDPTNATMKFIGENGELTDYIAKCMFKPNYVTNHENIISEAGDAWYYFRILSVIYNFNEKIYHEHVMGLEIPTTSSNVDKLYMMNGTASGIGVLLSVKNINNTTGEVINVVHNLLSAWLFVFQGWLNGMNIAFDEMHTYNVKKLSGADNHGWNPNDNNV